ncbi:hypothetical protein KL930_002494 [Ogataea haglerorum]|uniref:CN hydrolase domain-containing protein n=1 Tax=Ogataea haglerorum TaxID=1937702 RepID=A0AAN6D7V1_9ASCO|nr:hypothetical protein KL915_002319 [Ogataea haglerorum]KAG7707726.1 hypothetical protein KL914_002547 [Ogataea haglerorum]KAG7709763.1 hypothetical protein KL950_001982 [Ogataea haglerorum]KAG7729323.1 hypothetical protein KL933_001549 [Ogataea haglerorum]KAG7732097.1 hypothetical protein KL948_002295 [Ogataea haglerorum]
MRLRIAAIQLNPLLGKFEENACTALRLVDQIRSKKPDIVIFPEMALTGYNFAGPNQIDPYLEEQGGGKSFEFAKRVSQSLKCHTVLGYPERHSSTTYNSAMLIGPDGSLVHNYRKSFLYKTDETWGAKESPTGFEAFDIVIKDCKIRSTIGICMDLNPYKFEAPFDAFEFANFCLEKQVQLILVPTAWMSTSWSEDWKDQAKYTKLFEQQMPFEIDIERSAANDSILTALEEPYDRAKPDKRTAQYWLIRFQPLLFNKHEKMVLAVCNRSGVEGDLMYAGSSSIFRFNGNVYEDGVDLEVFGTLGQGVEGVLLRDVEV